jgi:hypothetical protein
MENPVLRIEVSLTSLGMELSMSDTTPISPLRQRMIEDMNARQLGAHSQRSHIYSCKRFAAFLMSIGIESGPLIGVQKGPPLDRRRGASRERARLHGAR